MAKWKELGPGAWFERPKPSPEAIVRAAWERAAEQIETHCYTSSGGERALEPVSSERLRGMDMHHATIAAFIRALASDPAEVAAIIEEAKKENKNG